MQLPNVGVPASLVQTSPVRLSVTVWLPLSLNLGLGQTTPTRRAPSSRCGLFAS
ncbi:hypothetical protein MBAV_005242 [Candidatus Magnetobacterium bavaricum]|uniref:Uncharacterized protein n=1 Tax=Candidatus Magnetobacterium bavaricum TaxID=29290 RepID=A0A0F3GPE9_9BACT|nr:hypothetical protein MBAV_005242 [Candidatus Magnetobacterium bavaricum]